MSDEIFDWGRCSGDFTPDERRDLDALNEQLAEVNRQIQADLNEMRALFDTFIAAMLRPSIAGSLFFRACLRLFPDDTLVPVGGAALLLLPGSGGRAQIYQLSHDGELPYVRIGKERFFRAADLRAYFT